MDSPLVARPSVRVIVVSDNPLVRTGMEALVRAMPEVTLLGSASLGDASSLAAQVHPDAAVLDAAAGEPEDLEPIARLATSQPGLPIVALAGRTNGLSQALSFGASALLPQATDPQTMRAALIAAASGLVALAHADLRGLLPQEDTPRSPTQVSVESLTARELEVLQWMARGLTNRQIAQRLKISEHTVKFHVGAVLGKLGAQSRAEAVARGISHGWILV